MYPKIEVNDMSRRRRVPKGAPYIEDITVPTEHTLSVHGKTYSAARYDGSWYRTEGVTDTVMIQYHSPDTSMKMHKDNSRNYRNAPVMAADMPIGAMADIIEAEIEAEKAIRAAYEAKTEIQRELGKSAVAILNEDYNYIFEFNSASPMDFLFTCNGKCYSGSQLKHKSFELNVHRDNGNAKKYIHKKLKEYGV